MTSSLESLLAHGRAKIAARFGGIVDLNLTDNNLNEHLNNTNPSTNDILSNVTHNVTLSLSTVTRKRSYSILRSNLGIICGRGSFAALYLSPQSQSCQHSFGSFFCYQPVQLLFIYRQDICPFTWAHILPYSTTYQLAASFSRQLPTTFLGACD